MPKSNLHTKTGRAAVHSNCSTDPIHFYPMIHGLLRISCSRNPKTPQIHCYFSVFCGSIRHAFSCKHETHDLLTLVSFYRVATVAISISDSLLMLLFSRLVISACAVSRAVRTFTPVSIAFLRIRKPSFACSTP